jgi:hypothetical protein
MVASPGSSTVSPSRARIVRPGAPACAHDSDAKAVTSNNEQKHTRFM